MCTYTYIHLNIQTYIHTHTLTYIHMHIHHTHVHAKIKFKTLWQIDAFFLCVIGMGACIPLCVYRSEDHSVKPILFLPPFSGFRVEVGSSDLHGQVLLSTEPPHSPKSTFISSTLIRYKVSLWSYKLSALSWNGQVFCLSSPSAGIRDSDYFSWQKPFLYSISDIKIRCFSFANNQYIYGCPTIWSQYCSCQKPLGDTTQTSVNSECIPTTLPPHPRHLPQTTGLRHAPPPGSPGYTMGILTALLHVSSFSVSSGTSKDNSLRSPVYDKGHYWIVKWRDRCR